MNPARITYYSILSTSAPINVGVFKFVSVVGRTYPPAISQEQGPVSRSLLKILYKEYILQGMFTNFNEQGRPLVRRIKGVFVKLNSKVAFAKE